MKPVLIAALFILQTAAPAASPGVIQALTARSDGAIQAGNYDEASLWWNKDLGPIVSEGQLSELTPSSAFALIEAARAGDKPYIVWIHAPNLARAAFAVGEFDKAERYARQALAGPGQHMSMGQAIEYGNQVLGRLSLRAGDVESAKNISLPPPRHPVDLSSTHSAPPCCLPGSCYKLASVMPSWPFLSDAGCSGSSATRASIFGKSRFDRGECRISATTCGHNACISC